MIGVVELSDGIGTAAAAIGIVVGVAGLYAFLWAAGKVQGTEKSIELLSTSLDAMNATLERERHERELEHAEALRDANERDRVCTERIAELEARLELVTSGFVERVGASIADVVRTELRKTT
jgi:hypothetical protein